MITPTHHSPIEGGGDWMEILKYLWLEFEFGISVLEYCLGLALGIWGFILGAKRILFEDRGNKESAKTERKDMVKTGIVKDDRYR